MVPRRRAGAVGSCQSGRDGGAVQVGGCGGEEGKGKGEEAKTGSGAEAVPADVKGRIEGGGTSQNVEIETGSRARKLTHSHPHPRPLRPHLHHLPPSHGAQITDRQRATHAARFPAGTEEEHGRGDVVEDEGRGAAMEVGREVEEGGGDGEAGRYCWGGGV